MNDTCVCGHLMIEHWGNCLAMTTDRACACPGFRKENTMDDFHEMSELTELREVTCGALSVVVDFNELLGDKGEEATFTLIGKLKDLLA